MNVNYDAPQPHDQATSFSPQEQALIGGMLYGRKIVTAYSVDSGGNRVVGRASHRAEFDALVREFRLEPVKKLKFARQNIQDIMSDLRMSSAERRDRVSRYLDAYFSLQLKLDKASYPPSDQVIEGVPDYIPDGLSDMGSDPSLNPAQRNRERIRVDKAKLFASAKPLFEELLAMRPPESLSAAEWSDFIVKRVAHYVYTSMPYDYSQRLEALAKGNSIALSDVQEQNLAVCRHHALATQVLLQSLGITSRLLKSEVTFGREPSGPHVNNLVRINNKWYLLDTTAPEKVGKDRHEIFLKPIPEATIDTNAKKYTWKFMERVGRERMYTSRSDMYYRIRSNTF